jgi:hypothetical protein
MNLEPSKDGLCYRFGPYFKQNKGVKSLIDLCVKLRLDPSPP